MDIDLTLQERRFTSYVRTSLRRYTWRWRKAMRCRQAREPLLLNERIVSEDGSSCERINLIASPLLVEDSLFLSLPLTEVIGWLELAQGLVGLPEHQRVILTGLVVDEETQQVVADRLGISQQAVHKNKVNAIYKLRDACKLKEG